MASKLIKALQRGIDTHGDHAVWCQNKIDHLPHPSDVVDRVEFVMRCTCAVSDKRWPVPHRFVLINR